MLIISVGDMKIIAKRETKKKQKRTRGYKSYRERLRAKWFCCAFKLGFSN